MSSRRFLFATIIVLAGLGGFIAYKEYTNRGEIIAVLHKTPAEALGAAALVADSDRDGLKDWEEELWHTDPLKPDTDGDGTTDGEEIKQGRNPLIPNTAPHGAPTNDRLDAETVATKVSPRATTTLSETERYARELFATYLSTQQEGTPLSQGDIDNIVNTVSASIPDEPAKLFTEKEMTTVDDETLATLRGYGNALGAALKKPWPSRENELTIFERAVKDPNPDTAALDFARLAPIADAYRTLAAAVAAIPAPRAALSTHLRLANAARTLGSAVSGMGAAPDDPVKIVASVSRYLDAIPQLGAALTEARAFLEARGISFSETEDGYALWKATQINQ